MTWSGAWSAARSQRPISGASRWPRRASGRSWSGTSGQADLACRINSSVRSMLVAAFIGVVGLVARAIWLLSPCHAIAELLPVRKRGSRTHRPYGGLACPPRRARSGGIHHRAAYAAALTVWHGGRNVDTRNEQSTWPHDTVGGGGGARLIRGDTANGPCQARVGRTAACVAKVSEGEVLMARGPGGMSFGAASGCPEIMRAGPAGRVGGP